jgi:hypothetical protein
VSFLGYGFASRAAMNASQRGAGWYSMSFE